MKPKVLILEDDLRLSTSLGEEFKDHGYDVFCAESLKSIPQCRFDFAVLDLRLPGESGLSAIEQIKAVSPNCRIVILSGYGSITTAVESIKKGAIDYLTKPSSFKKIEEALLGKKIAGHEPRDPTMPSLSQIEHEYIDFVLNQNQGNVSKTAKDLGLHRQSLQRKLKKYT